MRPNVLIAGAGPVGLFLAGSLRRLGVSIRIIDKAPERSDKSKALVIWPRTLEAFRIDGQADNFVGAGLRITEARITAGRRPLAQLSFGQVDSAFPYALFLPQSDTERLLDQELAGRGAKVERGVELVDFTRDSASVRARLRHAGGREEVVEADWLVGCDGAHSTVRHVLQLPFSGETMPSRWMLADVHLDGPAPQAVVISWRPDGLLALFPITTNRYRVVADTPGAATDPEVPTLADVQQLLDARGPGGLRAYDPVWLNRFHINERKVADYQSGRVFVIGDAAHVHSPAGGQGMNTGLQDAASLAWKLALVCRGAATPRLLESVSMERSAIGDQVLRNAGRLTRLAIMRNPIRQGLRNAAVRVLGHMAPFRRRLVQAMTELDLHYAESPLNGSVAPGVKLRAGHRAPDFTFRQPDGSSASLGEMLRKGRFLILSVSRSGQGMPAIELSRAESGLAATATTETESAVYRPGFHYVIRPDGHVAMVVDRVALTQIHAYLSRWLPGT